ncbi:MAG: anaerobic magnesium-protoporphyrin monomethyl ester cyclase, partial [Pseudonocardiales bacterium]|nr:anaerobic magnesium-protoporphyrin monomethyl ester cyclase [Pseudonocardiales bacterium]
PGSELFERAVAAGEISYRDALHIDTAKSTLKLSAIAGPRLEDLVSDFLLRYNVAMRDRDQDAWDRKYQNHTARMATICIGQASPNTSAVILAN